MDEDIFHFQHKFGIFSSLEIKSTNQITSNPNADEVNHVLMKYNSDDRCGPCPCVILLLMAHFGEQPEGLILEADALATAADVERTLLLLDSPRLIVLGEVLTASRWMVSIEGRVFVPPQPNFVAGLAAVFSSYYTFNLEYQEQACFTLEFIQRCFIGINPTRGTKTKRMVRQSSGKVLEKRNNSVSPQVSSLLRRIMDYEWLKA